MRLIIVVAMLLSAGCAERNIVNRGASTGTSVPAARVKKSQPGESLEEPSPKTRTALDPDAKPETTNYD